MPMQPLAQRVTIVCTCDSKRSHVREYFHLVRVNFSPHTSVVLPYWQDQTKNKYSLPFFGLPFPGCDFLGCAFTVWDFPDPGS